LYNQPERDEKMKRRIALLLTLCMSASLFGCGSKEAAETESTAPAEQTEAAPAEDSTDSEEVSSEASYELSALNGSYVELFPEFMKDEYKDTWVEYINAYETDPDTVEAYYQKLTQSYVGTITGQEAIDTYTDDSFQFDCFFENDVNTITVDGDTISGTDSDGNEIFSNQYTYVEDMDGLFGESVREGYFHVFKTDAEDAGQFTYFIFTDDTPSDTYHIEFRYGDNLDELGLFTDGDYAYWLPSGISQDYDDEMMNACIKLFVDENLGGE